MFGSIRVSEEIGRAGGRLVRSECLGERILICNIAPNAHDACSNAFSLRLADGIHLHFRILRDRIASNSCKQGYVQIGSREPQSMARLV